MTENSLIRIIGDTIEYDNKTVAHIIIPESTLRDKFLETLEIDLNENEKLKDEISFLNDENESLSLENEELRSELSSIELNHEDEMANLRDDIRDLENEIMSLNFQLSEIRESD